MREIFSVRDQSKNLVIAIAEFVILIIPVPAETSTCPDPESEIIPPEMIPAAWVLFNGIIFMLIFQFFNYGHNIRDKICRLIT